MAVQNMTDAPRISSADELDRAVTHAPLFEAVKSPRLKALLEETLQRMSGLGEDAESQPSGRWPHCAIQGEALDALAQSSNVSPQISRCEPLGCCDAADRPRGPSCA
jgi:hypothetical protein